MKALRFHLIALPGRVVSHARKLIIRLGAGTEALKTIVNARQAIQALGTRVQPATAGLAAVARRRTQTRMPCGRARKTGEQHVTEGLSRKIIPQTSEPAAGPEIYPGILAARCGCITTHAHVRITICCACHKICRARQKWCGVRTESREREAAR